MRIIDAYITRSITLIFLATIALFCFLYVLIDLASNMDDFLSNQVPLGTVMQYYSSFLPVIFVQTSPIACLLATLFTYSSLNNNNEIIALRASGFNFWKISRPALIFSCMVAAVVFMVNEKFAPQAASLSQEIKQEQIKTRPAARGNKRPPVNKLFFYGLDNRLFFIDEFSPSDQTIKGITVISQDPQQRMTEKITAMAGEWTGTGWKFINCQITRYHPEDQSLYGDAPFFKEKTVDIRETPQDILKQKSTVSTMNIRELRAYIKRFKGSGATAVLNNLKVDLHHKIAYPFACIIIILAGLPFALVTGRRKGLTFASVGIALMIGFLFFVVNSVGLALGKGGALHPVAAAWFSPVLFLIAGAWVTKKLF